MSLSRAGEGVLRAGAGCLIVALCASLAFDLVARWIGLALAGGAILAGWLFAFLATASVFSALPAGRGLREWIALALCGFALATLLLGLVAAGERVGGTEAIIGLPRGWRFFGAAGCLAASVLVAALRGPARAAALAAGGALALVVPAMAPLWGAPLWGAALFGVALVLRVPVALALIAAVALSPGALGDAALAQTVLRGIGPSVLLAVPLFVLAGALMVAGGIGEAIVAAARWLARARQTAAGEANVFASLLFGGVSGSGIADAALGARLLVPAMVRGGYGAGEASALTAASAIVPNLVPPSIALLLAAAATEQSVGRLWLAGIGAGAVCAAALWAMVRWRPPGGALSEAPARRPSLAALLPAIAIALGVVGGLRAGLVTATEAGLVAVVLAALYGVSRRGPGPLWRAACEAGLQSGRIALLIGAATPVSFLVATSGLDVASFLPAGPSPLVLIAAAALCLAAGTVLDVGAAILLLLPLLLPAATLSGADPIHATLVIVTALLIGGLTPPVGILILTVREITGARGAFRATIPYLLGLAAALGLIIAVPWLTAGLSRL